MERLAVYAGTCNIYHDMTVSARSLLYHNGADRIVFLIEDDTFPEELPECVSVMNVSGQTYFRPDGPNFNSRWTYMVMMRTALTKLFPDADRILSLDHDTIIRKPIDDLWRIDLSGYYFAAVEEKQITVRKHPYYNFGVVMHNLAKLREDAMDDAIIANINSKYFGYCEQDAVNDLCYGKFLPLPPEYNAYNFQSPRVPEENVIIRHYAACGANLRNYADYKTYDRMSWAQALSHTGITPERLLTRHDIINAFITDRGYHSFLEIGTDKGASLSAVKVERIVSVDPDTSTPATHHATSDAFFAVCNEKYDIIFIDGLHEHNQAYRDILNALYHLNPGGVIVMHDCLPTSEQMQAFSLRYPGGIWTGDVWKAFVKARAELPYLMYTIDTDFGCGIIDTVYGTTTESRHGFPSDMETMTYDQFVRNRNDWMNVKEEIQHAG